MGGGGGTGPSHPIQSFILRLSVITKHGLNITRYQQHLNTLTEARLNVTFINVPIAHSNMEAKCFLISVRVLTGLIEHKRKNVDRLD